MRESERKVQPQAACFSLSQHIFWGQITTPNFNTNSSQSEGGPDLNATTIWVRMETALACKIATHLVAWQLSSY